MLRGVPKPVPGSSLLHNPGDEGGRPWRAVILTVQSVGIRSFQPILADSLEPRVLALLVPDMEHVAARVVFLLAEEGPLIGGDLLNVRREHGRGLSRALW